MYVHAIHRCAELVSFFLKPLRKWLKDVSFSSGGSRGPISPCFPFCCRFLNLEHITLQTINMMLVLSSVYFVNKERISEFQEETHENVLNNPGICFTVEYIRLAFLWIFTLSLNIKLFNSQYFEFYFQSWK